MSWAEVFKINSNMKKPLNEQLNEVKEQLNGRLRNTICLPMRVITFSSTYTPEKTGLYKVICVGGGGGAGGGSSSSYSGLTKKNGGGGGGVAIKTLRLSSTTSYNVTVSTTASFSTELSATAGTSSSVGTASGGDSNYQGHSGNSAGDVFDTGVVGGSVGVAITELTRTHSVTHTDFSSYITELRYGDSLLGYGGGAPTLMYYDEDAGRYYTVSMMGQPAAVIIIPLEMEE